MVRLRVKCLPHFGDLPLPAYATLGSAGLDLAAAITDDVTLAPGARMLIPTGLAIALPDGFEGQIRPRSGLAAKQGVTVLNSPGTIDCDYRGEVKVLLINLGDQPVILQRGQAIAQLVVQSYTRAELATVDDLDETVRGEGGFGSTDRRK